MSKQSCISVLKGDLFSCPPNECMAHCISADAKLGKGIAVIFKKKFGGIDEIVNQGQKAGGCAILKRDSRYIYNLVTKDRYFDKPTYQTMESSLKKMHQHCVLKHVKKVSMPKIGAGLDRLDWTKVMKIIQDIFDRSDISITVYEL